MRFSPEQERSAHRLGQDVCVVAGPGSGKTRVLAERFCWLVREQGIKPDRILAITFTEKAAININLRLVESFHYDPGRRQQIESAYVSTIHGFCTRLLRENAVAAGVDVQFGVLNEASAGVILRESAGEALEALFQERPDEIRLLLSALYVSTSPFGRQPGLAESLTKIYEAIRVAGVDVISLDDASTSTGPSLGDVVSAVEDLTSRTSEWSTPARQSKRDSLLEWLDLARPIAETTAPVEHLKALARLQPNRRGLTRAISQGLKNILDELIPAARAGLLTIHFSPLRSVMLEALSHLDLLYRERKRALAKLDFSDLEERALDLLRNHPGVHSRIQERFDYILMDELQDTNPLQWQILGLIRRPERFFAVGDINQSIYGFRHADPDVFRRYRDSLEADGLEIDLLTENYRSRPEILDAAHSLLNDLNGIEPHMLVAAKDFAPAIGPVVEAVVASADTTEEAALKEARWIAHRIRAMDTEKPGQLSSIAVLTRKRNSLKLIEEALNDLRIPCLVIGGRTLLESREVRDLTMLLAVLANTRDEISLAGVLRSPLVGIHDETLLRLKGNGGLWKTMAVINDRNTYGIALDDVERLLWFTSLLEGLRSNRDAVSPDRLLSAVIDESDYEGGLDARARGNVEKFLALVRDLHQDAPRPLAELLDDLIQLRQAASESEAPPGEASNAVQLMSMHGAKGLEFPVVFLAALNKGVSDDLGPLFFSPEHGLGVKWRDPATQSGFGDSIYQAAETSQKLKMAREENRLLYVAMTRAEQHLLLTYSTSPGARGSNWSKLISERLAPDHDDAGGPGNTLPPPAVAPDEPEDLLDYPIISDQHDSAVSVTHLGDFLVCPRKYYLAGYLGFKPVARVSRPATEISPAEIGTQVHALLAGTRVDNPSPEAIRLVETYKTSGLARRIELADRIEREFDFAMGLDQIVIRGQIDLWFEKNNKLALVDYKTDQFDPSRQPERLEPYSLQLQIYALALRRLTGKLPSEALLHFLRSGQTIPVTVDESSLNSVVKTVHAFRKAQEMLEYPLKEGLECRHCLFYGGMCPAGKGSPSA